MKLIKFDTSYKFPMIDGKLLQVRDAPGPSTLLKGDYTLGYFGWWNDTSDPSFPTRADVLAVANPGGANLYDDGWLKFAYNGKILYVAKKPLVNSVSWDGIYLAGAVYGTDNIGLFGTQYAPYGIDWTGAKIRITGTLTPSDVASGTGASWNDKVYYEDGSYNGAMSYYNQFYYIWWDGIDSWKISDTKGGGTILFSRTAVNPWGGTFGVVNGSGTPTSNQIVGQPTLQNKILTKNKNNWKIRLMTGATQNPGSVAGGEWNDLIYRVHISDPLGLGNGLWDSFTNNDIHTNGANGSHFFTIETHTTSSFPMSRIMRGYGSVTGFMITGASSTNYAHNNSFRPVLEYIP